MFWLYNWQFRCTRLKSSKPIVKIVYGFVDMFFIKINTMLTKSDDLHMHDCEWAETKEETNVNLSWLILI